MRLNIKVKLMGGFLIVIALLLAVFGVGFQGLTSVGNATDVIVHEELPEDEGVRELELLITEQEALYFEAALTLDHETLLHAEALNEEISHQFDVLLSLFHTGDPLIASLGNVEVEWLEFLETGEAMAAAYLAGDSATGLALSHEFDAEVVQMEAELAEIVATIEENVEASFLSAESAKSSAITLMIALAVIAALAAAAIGFWLSISISKGVSTVGAAMNKIAVGDLSEKVNIKSQDEIGDMAKAYAEMQVYLGEMATVAEKLGDGDLTVQVRPKSEADTLGNSFVRMVDQLRSLVLQVRSGADSMTEASAQLSTAAEQSGQATQEVAAAATQMAKGSEEQTETVNEAATAVAHVPCSGTSATIA
ncbi:MAG: methyl-accepting chemotaxis protein [Chloroflexi bacterium]|nr:methyl-accepting chemotaxis protein [Chloroflexota bacterium]